MKTLILFIAVILSFSLAMKIRMESTEESTIGAATEEEMTTNEEGKTYFSLIYVCFMYM